MSNIHTIADNKKWRDFFDRYRSLPALWDPSTEEYKNKHKKLIAYEKLLSVYKKIDPDANIQSVKHRIFNIRTCYKRELNKIQLSEYSGADEIYVPRLWYFQTLDFLRNQSFDGNKKNYCVKEVKDEGDTDDNNDTIYENILPTEEIYLQKPNEEEEETSPARKKKRSIEQCFNERNSLLRDALGQLKKDNTENESDEAAVYALGWAASYRKLDETQQLYAKKAIEDILILGQLNQLHFKTVPLPTDL